MQQHLDVLERRTRSTWLTAKKRKVTRPHSSSEVSHSSKPGKGGSCCETNFQAFYSKDYQEAEVLHLWAGQGCKRRSTKEGLLFYRGKVAWFGRSRTYLQTFTKSNKVVPIDTTIVSMHRNEEACLFLHLLQAYYSRSLQYMADDPSTWANRALVRALVRHSCHSTAQLVLCAGDK